MKKKSCSKCKKVKSTKEFYSHGKKENMRLYSHCKSCFNLKCILRWKQKKLHAIKKLGNKCADCNQSYHPNVYDFHHLYDKDYNWTKLRLRSQQSIDNELNKCVLLCANCHRLRHAHLD